MAIPFLTTVPRAAASMLVVTLCLVCHRTTQAFLVPPQALPTAAQPTKSLITIRHLSDWSSFQAMDDDEDEDLFGDTQIDRRAYAVEDDDDETKAAVGATLDPPTIDDPPVDPIQVPTGSQLEMSEEPVLGVLQAAREELGTLFGYTAENRGVGITGGVDFVEMDGPTVVIRLKGRCECSYSWVCLCV